MPRETLMYLMEHAGEGHRMENRDLEEARRHLARAGLRAGDRALDLGCASGLITRLMASICAPGEAIGVDQSEERIEMARARALELAVPNVSFVRGDAYALPFDDACFDLAFSRYTFEYLREPLKALQELKRVVRPGGRVVVIDLDGNGMFHYPVPPALEQALSRLSGALGKAGFDPYIGRKLFNLFHQVGFRRIDVQAEPHHLIAGEAPPDELEGWTTKLKVIRSFALKAFPSESDYDALAEQCLELLRRGDTLTYSVSFLVTGVV